MKTFLFAVILLLAQVAAVSAKPKFPIAAPEQKPAVQKNEGLLASKQVLSAKSRKRKQTKVVRASESRAAFRRGKVRRPVVAAQAISSGAALRAQVQLLIAADETAGEDEEVRRIAVKALGNHAGTVVVMDPNSGRIYSIVNQQWGLRGGFKPCSTIKLVTGLAGLNEKLIATPELTNISNAYGMDLTRALAHSDNGYFQQVGGRVGFDKLMFYARQFGLGEKTGINVSDESAGQVPLYKSGYAVNHMSSHGDDFQVTALQLATLVSAMSNGGKLLTPYVPRVAHANANLKPLVRRQISLAAGVMGQMVPGMVGAVSYGTARRAFDPLATIAGKTGTCIQDGNWVGLFASYAPLAQPSLAVVVIGSGPDARGHFPAAVAGEIYRNLNHRFGRQNNQQVAQSYSPGDAPAAVAGIDDDRHKEASVLETVSQKRITNRSERPVLPGRLLTNSSANHSLVRRVLLPVAGRPQVASSETNSKNSNPAIRPRLVPLPRR